MNILYLSHLGGESWAGPTYSVPKQISAQAKYDNVFWYNAVTKEKEEWKQFPFYHNLEEYPQESIYALPAPFNNPDLVVVESFYNMTASRFLRELVFGNIPYIIIPRGELTERAQNRKKLKKTVANILICKRYARKAAAIQYLTQQEYEDSTDSWNKNALIIPNGIDLPQKSKTEFAQNGLKCVSIGRIEPYQKGLDLLIEACAQIKDRLAEAKCTITICGPDNENKVAVLKQMVQENGLEGIVEFRDAVFGSDKEKILLESDVFIIPSRFEGHPMALIEALSYGLPCVATTGSNMREEINAYRAGWTCDVTVDSIRGAMLAMLDSTENLQLYSCNARNLSKQYDWNTIAGKSHEEYQIYTK